MSEVLVWLGLVGLCIVERSLDDHIPAVPRAIDRQHVWFRHFNFLDFEALGQAAPKRMISMFYYSRAARTRELSRQMYPDTPQPDQHFLGRDFETCVLQVE